TSLRPAGRGRRAGRRGAGGPAGSPGGGDRARPCPGDEGERDQRARRARPRGHGDQGRAGGPGPGLPLHRGQGGSHRARDLEGQEARALAGEVRGQRARWAGPGDGAEGDGEAVAHAAPVDAAAGREGGALRWRRRRRPRRAEGATARATSRYSRAWSRSASGRRCTSAAPTSPGTTTSSGRSSTTASTR